MSERDPIPASEVVREAESCLRRVATLRDRAAALLREAEQAQQEAFDLAVRELGDKSGCAAYELACLSLSLDPGARAKAQEHPADRSAANDIARTPTAPSAAEAVEAPPRERADPRPAKVEDGGAEEAPPSPVTESSDAEDESPVRSRASAVAPLGRQAGQDPTKVVLHGVELPRSKLGEAERVVAEATKAAAQKHKSNPYEGNRGRNAWRDHLFCAVLEAEGAKQSADKPAGRSEPPSDAGPADSDAPHALPEADHDELPDEPQQSETVPATRIARADAPESALSSRTAAPRPSRAVPLTRELLPRPSRDDPSGDASGTRDVLDDGADAGPSRAEPSPASSGSKLHEPKPITGRGFAFGQASPMPAGLKEELARRGSGAAPEPSSQTVKPAAPQRPVFAKPTFLQQK